MEVHLCDPPSVCSPHSARKPIVAYSVIKDIVLCYSSFSSRKYHAHLWGILLLASLITLSDAASSRCDLTTRIPQAIVPDAYSLALRPYVMEGSFRGSVNIIFKLKSPIRCVPVHVDGLTVASTEMWGPQGKVAIVSMYEQKENHYWVTEAKKDLIPGNYNISISFSGNAMNKLDGYYRSSYRMPNETHDRYLMTTKFEPTNARQAFPCFDEPMLKARFKISITRPNMENYISLSNSKAVREVPGPSADEITTDFEETPAMSTYLVAAIVCDFKDLGPVSVKSGGAVIPFRVYAAPHLVKGTAFARSVGKAVLEFFIDYFDIPFPLPKMDLIAIPDFISGAMENWGLITFRETKLVVMDTARSFNTLRRVAHVVAHELSHQWFGNLVTMKWWDDLWLNEGFARFMEYKGVGSLTDENTEGPLVRLEDSPDLLDLKMNVMVKDAFLNSHPIVVKVSKPEQISEIFDVISYAKGASILTMIEHLMGEEAFRTGVQKYLKKHAFGNAASIDLLTALSHQSNIPLTDRIKTWTNQMGFPIVNVRKGETGYELTQQRFINDNSLRWSPETSPFGYKWDIPICFLTPDKSAASITWLLRKDKNIVLPSSNEPWIKLNCKGASYYRTNYDETMWLSLADLLRSNASALDAEDRANLLDDSFALANAGFLDFGVPMKLSSYLPQERVRLALSAGFSQLLGIKGKLGDPESELAIYIKTMSKKLFDDVLGDYNFDFTKNQLKREEEFYILNLGCRVALKKCREPVADHFRQWVNNEITIVPDLRQLVYSTGMKTAGSDEDWKQVLEKYRTEPDPQEKELLMSALVATKNEMNLKKLLNESLQKKLVRPQDFFPMLSRVGTAAPAMAWQWYKEHYDQLVERFGLSDKGLGRALEAIAGKFRSKKKLNDLKSFFKKNREGGAAAMARKRAIEKIQSNMDWVERAKNSVARFFSDSSNKKYLRTTPPARPVKRTSYHHHRQKGYKNRPRG